MTSTNEQSMEIKDRRSYVEAIKLLNREMGPPALLRAVMNAAERYRQARKIGWSRPWNKYGVTTFRSYRLDPLRDDGLIRDAADILDDIRGDLPTGSRTFVTELLSPDREARAKLMGFIFYQELVSDSGKREAATLSLGRINEHKRHRDRIDLIFESTPIPSEEPLAIETVRVIVDPFEGVAPPLFDQRFPIAENPHAEAVVDTVCDLFHDWNDFPDRHWSHWTQKYIDYFGPRDFDSAVTLFPIQPSVILPSDTPVDHEIAGKSL